MSMDLIAYPFTSQVTYDEQGLPLYDRPVDAEVLRNIQKQYFTDGVFAVPATSFQVSPIDGGMTVQVAPGSCVVQGTTGYRLIAGTLDIESAGNTDRYDAIVLRLDDSQDVRAVRADVVRGASNGTYYTPTRTDTIWELIIAYVKVRAKATSITVLDVEDTRLNTSLCGLVRLPMVVPDTDPYFVQVQAYVDYLAEVIQGVIDGSEYMLKTAYDPSGEVAAAGGITAVLHKVYPVGSYYISDNNTNPAETLGFGTWARTAIGKMLVGVNENDTPFNVPGKTGGSQTHSLVEGNIPSHRHTVPALSGSAASNGAHTHTGPSHTHTSAAHSHANTAYTSSTGEHTHTATVGYLNGYNSQPDRILYDQRRDAYSRSLDSWDGSHNHNITVNNATTTPGATGASGTGATGSAGAHTHTVSTTASNTGYYGSGDAVNHMNPYETAYIWKRTA